MSKILSAMVLTSAALSLAGCATDSQQKGDRTYGEDGRMSMTREQEAQNTVAEFRRADAGLSRFFDNSAGYAVFPKVSQGGLVVGGWGGQGVVFERGMPIGYAEVGGASIGAQIGGQTFSEIIFFKDKTALEDFKRGNAEFDAKVSAVAAKSGAAARNDYNRGVAVFITDQRGLMLEAALGGQKFRYWPR